MNIKKISSLVRCCAFLLLFVLAIGLLPFGNSSNMALATGPGVPKPGSEKVDEEAAREAEEIKAIVKQAEALKKELIDLNRELYLFEEELLYPRNTQLAVFLSIANKSSFLLDSIELSLDDQIVTSYLYDEGEIKALKNGGIQRLYIGSLSDGNHKLTARFNGLDGNSRYFRQKKSLTFNKEEDAKYLQLMISESPSTREPLFKVRQW